MSVKNTFGLVTDMKPVAWIGEEESGYQELDWDKNDLRDFPFLIPLYTVPPKREWTELTEEEIETCSSWCMNRYVFARKLEAKIREKNG